VLALARTQAWVPPSLIPPGVRLTIGQPFAIESIDLAQLRDIPAAQRLMREHKTYVVLYPVMAEDMVVDSFLMARIKGHWVERGYANNEVTRRLVRIRAAHAARGHEPPDVYYFVSIPEVRAFFAAFERGAETMLISTTTDPLIHVSENDQPRSATDIFTRIIRPNENNHQ
jgi:hypothetical protein